MCKITVVVPTRNRAAYLEKFFFSLEKQTLSMENYEMILVDNGSTDETKSLCGRWQDKITNFKYIYEDHPGLHVGRNIGYQKSSSEIIVFADDDIVATDTWLEAIVDGFERHPEAVLIGGSNIPQFEKCPPQWVDLLWQKGTSEKDEKVLVDYSCILLGEYEKEISPYYVFGCNFAIRKWVLDETHGFHPDGMPDDFLCYRGDGESFVSQYIIQNGLKTYFIPDASVYHCVPVQRMKFEYIGKVAYRTGISEAYQVLRTGTPKDLQRRIWKKKLKLQLRRSRLSQLTYMKEKEQIMGNKFLLYKYKSTVSVREWIHREDYLGENGRIGYKQILGS